MIYLCCLRFLREFEKWSEVVKIGKNWEKWGKIAVPDPPYIHYYQASNKFYVDTIVEAATAGDKALSKIQDGIFQSNGEIDMNGNSITGLPNPIDRDAAANKNYVDNGGAITKLPNGAFTVVSDIDFNGFTLKKIPDPIDVKRCC